jgi:hypothetical protein
MAALQEDRSQAPAMIQGIMAAVRCRPVPTVVIQAAQEALGLVRAILVNNNNVGKATLP